MAPLRSSRASRSATAGGAISMPPPRGAAAGGDRARRRRAWAWAVWRPRSAWRGELSWLSFARGACREPGDVRYSAATGFINVNHCTSDFYICKFWCQERTPAGASRQMTAALEQHDWSARLARRAGGLGGGEITAILALAGATDVITFSGGFPDPQTFPAEILSGIAARLIAEDAGVALQYSATEGLAGVRDYVAGRLASREGAAPGP